MAAVEHLGEQFEPVYSNRFASAKVTPSGYVYNIGTNVEHRGEGHARALLEEITAHADILGRPLTMNAREELHPWYASHGFEAGADRSTPFAGVPLLVRPPRRSDA